MLSLGEIDPDWATPVISLTASTGDRIDELIAAIAAHRSFADGEPRRSEGRRRRATEAIGSVLRAEAMHRLGVRHGDGDSGLIEAVATRRLSPSEAARRLLT